jgi:hypothetical protein
MHYKYGLNIVACEVLYVFYTTFQFNTKVSLTLVSPSPKCCRVVEQLSGNTADNSVDGFNCLESVYKILYLPVCCFYYT